MSKYSFNKWETMYASEYTDRFVLTGKHSDIDYLDVPVEDIRTLANILHCTANDYDRIRKEEARFRNEPIDE